MLKNIQSRCRKVLSDSDEPRLNYGYPTLQWMMKKIQPGKPLSNLFYTTGKEPENEGFTSASLLYNNISAFNLDDSNNLSWAQYFSLLVITILRQASYLEHTLKFRLDSEDHYKIAYLNGFHIIEAMEAITISEMLSNDPCHQCTAVEYSTKKVYSLKSAQQSIRKLQSANNLELGLIKFWNGENFKSKTDAARRYYAQVSEIIKTRTQESSIRDFSKTISDYEAGIDNIIQKLI